MKEGHKLYDISKTDKSIETESRFQVARELREGEMESYC